MQFRIADSFTKALGKLTAQEQSAVKITVFDLQQNPAAPGLQFHRIDKSKDPNFWSIRSNRDIRVIVHKTRLMGSEGGGGFSKWAVPLKIWAG